MVCSRVELIGLLDAMPWNSATHKTNFRRPLLVALSENVSARRHQQTQKLVLAQIRLSRAHDLCGGVRRC
jgi:hypothetical protein